MIELLRKRAQAASFRKMQQQEEVENYRDLVATELYCPKCRQAMPVRQRLLLVLPDGDLYEYRCIRCGTSVGEKKETGRENIQLII